MGNRDTFLWDRVCKITGPSRLCQQSWTNGVCW